MSALTSAGHGAIAAHAAHLREKAEREGRITTYNVRPPMDALCRCGTTYGQHRINDFACRNALWKPGNGQPQWTASTFRRAP